MRKAPAACDVADKGEICGEKCALHTAHKPFAASMPSKNNEVVRMGPGQIIQKSHRLGIDVGTNKDTDHVPSYLLHTWRGKISKWQM